MFGPVHGYVSLPIDENVIKEAVAKIGPIAIGYIYTHNSFSNLLKIVNWLLTFKIKSQLTYY